MKTEIVTNNEMKQKDTSSGNKRHIFYEMQRSKNSPCVTSGILQDHTLTREVKYDELTVLAIKYHEGNENGEEFDGILSLDSSETFVVPTASHHQYFV